MATIYRKTAKGLSEVETRAHRLSPRLRSMLILVDGRRTDDDLRRMIQQQADESLIALVGDGFIEVVSVGASAPPAKAAAAPARAPAAIPTPAAARPVTVGGPTTASMPMTQPSAVEFTIMRRDAVRALNNEVGPMAETLAIKMERARDWSELRPLVDKALALIADVRGAAAAAAYRQRYADY
jgi:hypothetical protein